MFLLFYQVPSVHRDRGAGGAGGGGGGLQPPPIILEKKKFLIGKLLFYSFHRYAVINEDFRQ